MRKIVLLLLSFLLLVNCATALAKWNDRDIVERIRAVGNTPAAQKKADKIKQTGPGRGQKQNRDTVQCIAGR